MSKSKIQALSVIVEPPTVDAARYGRHTIDTDAEIKNLGSERVLSATATDDDIRQFRAALSAVLKTAGAENLGSPEAEWRPGWPAVADLGATSLCVPEEQGGSGMEVGVAVATAMELGAALNASPYPGIVASAHAIASSGAGGTSAELLAGLVRGERVCAFGELGRGTTVARNVDGALEADALLLADPVSNQLTLFPDQSMWTATETTDGFDVSRRSGDVSIDAAAGHPIGHCPGARHLFGLLLAADALGGTERVLDRTVAYARERHAFGRPIGGFQAVQHRLADHVVGVRGMVLLVRDAAQELAEDGPGTARAVALAEASVSAGAGHIVHDLLQLTGAIGFTWEYGLHFYQRRIHQDARLAANPRRAMHALAGLEGWTDDC